MNDSTPLFINLSNHPSKGWSEEQMLATEPFGKLVDIPFPVVNPGATADDVKHLAEDCVERILATADDDGITVHVMGEMTLTYRIVRLLKRRGITCVASTTERLVTTDENGNKVSKFRFVQFREY